MKRYTGVLINTTVSFGSMENPIAQIIDSIVERDKLVTVISDISEKVVGYVTEYRKVDHVLMCDFIIDTNIYKTFSEALFISARIGEIGSKLTDTGTIKFAGELSHVIVSSTKKDSSFNEVKPIE